MSHRPHIHWPLVGVVATLWAMRVSADIGPPLTRGTLVIAVSGLTSAVGSVRMALDPSANSFLKETSEEPEWRTVSQAVVGSTITIEIPDVAFGDYALRGFHDEDDNGKLNTNLLGIPSEPYGFSNQARRWLGPPTFADARFRFNSDRQAVSVILSPHVASPFFGSRERQPAVSVEKAPPRG